MTAAACPPRSGSSAPLLLAIETAGSGCSAAILRGGETLAAEARLLRHGHAEALLPMIERVACAAGVEPGDLALVAAAIGPGGFTGIRAGLAAAHGIALASGARLVGVTSFAAVAAASRARGSGCRSGQGAVEADGAPKLLVALDSRRADFYIQLFAEDHTTPLAEPVAILPDRMQSYVDGLIGGASLLVAGDMAELVAAALGLDSPVDLMPQLGARRARRCGRGAVRVEGRRNTRGRGECAGAAALPAPPDVTLPSAKILGPAAGL